MNRKTIRRVHRVTALITLAAIVFYLFFQVNKGGPFRDINPFGEDPYDAVGSFAIQGALLVGILTYARALRLRDAPSQATKTRLILRGNLLVLSAILVTLSADAIAEVVRPIPPSYWGNVLLVELALMFLLALICALALTVGVSVMKGGAFLPQACVEWVKRFNSDWLFARVPWLNPRTHPWRFAGGLGLLVGMGLALAHLQEGLPPSLKIGLLAAGIFISAELAATLLGFAILGGYLGLRSSFKRG
jgi:hypothetical protein